MPEITVCKVGDVAPGSAIRVDKDGLRLAVVAGLFELQRADAEQIGRASCRERVYDDV